MVHCCTVRAEGDGKCANVGDWGASTGIVMGDRINARLAVEAWSAWAPGRETRADWCAWAGAAAADHAADAPSPPAAPVPMMLRRRATPFGQKIVGSAAACGDALRRARYVLASRHGEFSRIVGILRALDAGELPSPAEFSMVVHHALTGLLSIGAGNTRGHTALAAGLDSFGFGLIEAASCLAEQPDEPVLLLYGDESLTGEYAAFADDDVGLPVVVALALRAPQPGEDVIVFEASPRAELGEPGDCAATVFLRFLITAAPAAAAKGCRMDWRWSRAA
jgi:beta-ketoacyl synthase-like protein